MTRYRICFDGGVEAKDHFSAATEVCLFLAQAFAGASSQLSGHHDPLTADRRLPYQP